MGQVLVPAATRFVPHSHEQTAEFLGHFQNQDPPLGDEEVIITLNLALDIHLVLCFGTTAFNNVD